MSAAKSTSSQDFDPPIANLLTQIDNNQTLAVCHTFVTSKNTVHCSKKRFDFPDLARFEPAAMDADNTLHFAALPL